MLQVGAHQDAYHEQPLWMSCAQASSVPLSTRDEALIARRAHFLADSEQLTDFQLPPPSDALPHQDEPDPVDRTVSPLLVRPQRSMSVGQLAVLLICTNAKTF